MADVYVPLPKLPGRLTADLIARSGQGLNAVKEYELNLRGTPLQLASKSTAPGCAVWAGTSCRRPRNTPYRQPYFDGGVPALSFVRREQDSCRGEPWGDRGGPPLDLTGLPSLAMTDTGT